MATDRSRPGTFCYARRERYGEDDNSEPSFYSETYVLQSRVGKIRSVILTSYPTAAMIKSQLSIHRCSWTKSEKLSLMIPPSRAKNNTPRLSSPLPIELKFSTGTTPPPLPPQRSYLDKGMTILRGLSETHQEQQQWSVYARALRLAE